MPTYTVTLTLSVEGRDENEAFQGFERLIKVGAYDHDSIEVEREEGGE
jgi:phosphotransferase system HPr-like phosphotransfer protein